MCVRSRLEIILTDHLTERHKSACVCKGTVKKERDNVGSEVLGCLADSNVKTLPGGEMMHTEER